MRARQLRFNAPDFDGFFLCTRPPAEWVRFIASRLVQFQASVRKALQRAVGLAHRALVRRAARPVVVRVQRVCVFNVCACCFSCRHAQSIAGANTPLAQDGCWQLEPMTWLWISTLSVTGRRRIAHRYENGQVGSARVVDWRHVDMLLRYTDTQGTLWCRAAVGLGCGRLHFGQLRRG